MIGPDGLTYLAMTIKESESYAVLSGPLLDEAIFYVAGCAFLDSRGEKLFVYSPGDLVSFKLFGRVFVEPDPKRYALADPEQYLSHGFYLSTVTPAILPPLAARSLEFYARRLYSKVGAEATWTPSICAISRTQAPADQSQIDLAMNLPVRAIQAKGLSIEAQLETLSRFLPWHMGRRLLCAPESLREEQSFTPLSAIVEHAGLKLANDR